MLVASSTSMGETGKRLAPTRDAVLALVEVIRSLGKYWFDIVALPPDR